MKNHQFGSPHIVEAGTVKRLKRVALDERGYTEDQLQSLLFDHPALLPAGDIEPVFNELIPICRELPTPAGPLDLLYATPQGDLCLVETKLWRNPEARRKVVAQIIDYAKEIAGWGYEELVEAVGRSMAVAKLEAASEDGLDQVAALVADAADDFEQQSFIDAVSRNLRLGRFLLLIVGDGIREDVEKITDFLQQTPNLGYTLGLIEIGMYQIPGRPDGELLFQPRTMCKTVNIERAVVEIRNSADPNLQIEVKFPEASKKTKKKSGRSSMTEEAFLESLEESATADAVAVAKEVLDKAGDYGLEIAWGDSGPLLKYDTGQDLLTFGQLNRNGKLTALHWLSRSCYKSGIDPGLAREHHQFLTTLLPGTDVYDRKINNGMLLTDVRTGKRVKIDRPDIAGLVGKVDTWLQAIAETAEKFEAEIEQVSDSET
jgi:hypothetical protein